MEHRRATNLNNKAVLQRDSRQWRRCVVALLIGVALVVGFAAAAQSHFAAHQCSTENARLQRERERLKNEQQRLLHEREMMLQPAALIQRAEKIGLQTRTVNNLDAVR